MRLFFLAVVAVALVTTVPGAVQEFVNYDVRTHHTNADFAERIDPAALKQASVMIATVVYQAAMRDGTSPRPAPPKPATTKQ